MTVTVQQLLTDARKLLEPEGSWCKGTALIVSEGDVVCRDVFTALCHAADQHGLATHSGDRVRILAAATAILAGTSLTKGISTFNDASWSTHADMLVWLDRSIAIAASLAEGTSEARAPS